MLHNISLCYTGFYEVKKGEFTMKTTDPMKKKNDIRQIRKYYLEKGKYRNFLMISFGLNTGLKMCDILRLKAEDIFDFKNKSIREHI